MTKHYLYKITCLCGSFKDHYYIGKRSSRKSDILHDCYYGSGEKLRRYYKKYPPELGVTITKEILEINPTKEINAQREKEVIGDLYLTDPMCLNLMEGGNGRKVSKETSQKKSISYKGRKLSDETRAKMSAAKIRDNSAQSLAKYYETHEVWNKGQTGLWGTPVACYDLDGNYIETFSSASLACEKLGLDSGSVSKHLATPDLNHKVKNYMFRYLKDGEVEMKIEPYCSLQKKRYSKITKPVIQYTLDGEYVNTYPSLNAATKSLGYKSAAHLSDCLAGRTESAWGYLWKKAS